MSGDRGPVRCDFGQGQRVRLAIDNRGRLRLERKANGYCREGEFLSAVCDLGRSGPIQAEWIEQWTAPQRWKKHSGNPIYGPNRPGNPKSGKWDSWTNGVSIVRSADGESYKMYYAGRQGEGIGFAEASIRDPLHWTENPASPVLRPLQNWEGNFINQPRVVKLTETHWRMYYTGWGVKGPGTSWGMGLAESFDGGVTWQRRGDGPLLPRGDASSPDGEGACVPTVLRLGDCWMMWYTAGVVKPGTKIHLCLAASEDGLAWQKYDHNPVLTDNFAAGPARNVISRCCVRYDDGAFRMWYSRAKPNYHICYAESLDGKQWEQSLAPALLPSSKPAWDDETVEYPEIDLVDGVWRMWFCGNGYGSVGYAEGICETGVSLGIRAGTTPTPDTNWTPWSDVKRRQSVAVERFVQVRIRLWSDNPSLSPTLNEIGLVRQRPACVSSSKRTSRGSS